jgi:hypothetical protein
MKRSSLVLGLSFATLCLFIAAGCSQKSTNDNSSVATTPAAANSATPKPKPNRPAPDFTVTATELAMESQVDSTMARDKYTAKQIVITGRIETVIDTQMEVLLATSGVTDFLVCKFDEEEKESLVALKPKQNVTLQCLGDYDSLNRPSLKHCTIVKVE